VTIFICVSATEAETARLLRDGPRRDFVELARATGGVLVYQRPAASRRGVWRRLTGPHVRQAWEAARRARPGDTVFADGEHIGLPLLGFLILRARRGVRVVMLGHFVTRSWKMLPLAILTRFGPATTLIVHSMIQARKIRPVLGRRCTLRFLPYQVDTDFWNTEAAPPNGDCPTLLAVGAEHRDYATLIEAVRDLPVRVRIAAGSYWARNRAAIGSTPENVEFLTQPLPFCELHAAYEAATAVVVPLEDVPNQSGVTTILEAMSMGRPVITSATAGQNECVSGPTIDGAEAVDIGSLSLRGPRLFDARAPVSTTGCYVPPGDVAAMRAAITRLLVAPEEWREMGSAGRRSACRYFTIERFVESLRDIIADTVPAASEMPLGVR